MAEEYNFLTGVGKGFIRTLVPMIPLIIMVLIDAIPAGISQMTVAGFLIWIFNVLYNYLKFRWPGYFMGNVLK
jgi:hypothetical protein